MTRWVYGVDESTGSLVARVDLVRAKVYPDGGEVEYRYNALGEVVTQTDQNATVHTYRCGWADDRG